MKEKALLVLAAGNSSRMKRDLEAARLPAQLVQQANSMPKGMIGLGPNGRPFLDCQLYNAAMAGFQNVALVLNPNDVVTQPYYQNLMLKNAAWGLQISFVRQQILPGKEKPLGTADAVQQSLEQLPEWAAFNIIACNSDNLYSVNVFGLLYNSPYEAALPAYNAYTMGFTDEKIKNCAILFVDGQGFLQKLIEKPDDTQIEKCIAQVGRLGISMNIFSFDYSIGLQYMTNQPLSSRGEKEMPEAISRFASQNTGRVGVFPVEEIMPDLTSKADILAVRAYLETNFPNL
jgi:glucose-1-phosphate adenylyltransferase